MTLLKAIDQEIDKCKIKLLQKSLSKSPLTLSELSTFQRIILITDGTLTDILEIYLLEKISICKLSEEIINLVETVPALNLKEGVNVIKRKKLAKKTGFMLNRLLFLKDWMFFSKNNYSTPKNRLANFG